MRDVLAPAGLGAFVTGLDATTVGAAVPSIGRDLGLGLGELSSVGGSPTWCRSRCCCSPSARRAAPSPRPGRPSSPGGSGRGNGIRTAEQLDDAGRRHEMETVLRAYRLLLLPDLEAGRQELRGVFPEMPDRPIR